MATTYVLCDKAARGGKRYRTALICPLSYKGTELRIGLMIGAY